MNRLQTALLVNAIFSSLSGIALIIGNRQIAQLFGTTNNTIFWVVGCVLIFFATTIVYEICEQRSWAVLWIIIQDALWVIGSVVLLTWNPFGTSQNGLAVIGFVALIVIFMAINQLRALNKQISIIRKKRYTRVSNIFSWHWIKKSDLED
ncbi:MAG: hypothetical protein WBG48_08480 [Pricia sp.]